MKTSLMDMNDFLFQQLETLSNPDLKGDELKEEIERSKAISNISDKVIRNAEVALSFTKLKAEFTGETTCPMIEGEKNE